MLPKTLAQFRVMGFHFASLDEVEMDPFYQSDIDPSLPGVSGSLMTKMYERGATLPPALVMPNLDRVCR